MHWHRHVSATGNLSLSCPLPVWTESLRCSASLPSADPITVLGDECTEGVSRKAPLRSPESLTVGFMPLPQALADACMDADPGRRPTFAELEPMLTALRKEYR